jgi:hypothetical protein
MTSASLAGENSASLTAETESALRVHEAVRSMRLPPETASILMIAFNLVWREALIETGPCNVKDRHLICALAADAVIAFAKAGLQPEQIIRFARSNLRFMRSSREAAAAM